MGGRIPDMEILLAGGKKKSVKELKVGDELDTLHQHTLERKESKISYVRVVESPLLELTLSGKAFTCSTEDVFYSTSKKGWINATQLSEGDKVAKLDGEVEIQGVKELGKGESVELTVDDSHTYVCDGVLLHNKGGSPPPPTIIMPPPPPQIVQDVTPTSTYQDASGYLKRMDDRERAIEERRWKAGATPGNTAVRHSGIDLATAELDARMNAPGASIPFGSQTTPGGSSSATAAVINALAPKPGSGSTSRQARLRAPAPGVTTTAAQMGGPEERLARAQRAYALAEQQKANENFEWKEFQEPEWANRDWFPEINKWKDRSDKVEVGDTDPKIIKA